MSGKLIHPKKQFVEDIRYVRSMLRMIETALQSGDWEEIADIAMETEGLLSYLRSRADDNRYGIKDSHCLPNWEIEAIVAARAEEARQKDLAAWQAAGEQVAREFEQALGFKFTVVTEGLEVQA